MPHYSLESLLLHAKMRVIHDINDAFLDHQVMATIGTFDGVHLGHQKILSRIIEIAKITGNKSLLITFDPHPRTVVSKDKIELITPLREKIELLDQLGLDAILIIPFTEQFAALSAQDFVQKYLLEHLKLKELVIGYDHQFGNNREGNIAYLKMILPKQGIVVNEIPAHEIDDVVVSSSKIRRAIAEGRVSDARRLLGTPITLEGTVVEGHKLGRTIGYPTANLQLSYTDKLLPKTGVYAVRVKHEGLVIDGMMNIGFRPTIGQTASLSIEIHLFNFQENLYGSVLKVYIYERFRDEKKFSDLDDLKQQLQEDEGQIIHYFTSI